MRENLEIRNYSVNDDGFKVGIPQEDRHIGTEGIHQEILFNFS